jgi:hypothetical protein
MRVVENTQMHIGEVDVSHIVLDAKSRDDIPQILRGLQYLYQDPDKRAKLFQLLESGMAPKVDKRTGRPGMTLWSIFVCGVIRLDLNIDYDRLHELVNQHNTIRQMLGHGLFDPTSYHYQTLKDNVTLFTPELLNKINQIVVDRGHRSPVPVTEQGGSACRRFQPGHRGERRSVHLAARRRVRHQWLPQARSSGQTLLRPCQQPRRNQAAHASNQPPDR